MLETVKNDYEVMSEGDPIHWEIPYDRLEDNTPTVTCPAAVLDGAAAGTGDQLTGTILSIDAASSIAVIDFTPGMVYYQYVRNVATYAAGVEATWVAIQFGHTVYYDRSSTMVALGLQLSCSPLDNTGTANPKFGRVVGISDADIALYPKGVAGVASTQRCGVMQFGINAE